MTSHRRPLVSVDDIVEWKVWYGKRPTAVTRLSQRSSFATYENNEGTGDVLFGILSVRCEH